MLAGFLSPSSSSEGADLHLLCPVRALKIYVDRSSQWRKSLQLLLCFGAGRRGLAASNHTISHWVRDAISLAYEVRSLPSPHLPSAHSTRGWPPPKLCLEGYPLRTFVWRQVGPLPILLWGSITLMWTQLLVPRFFLFEPAVFFGVLVCNGPDLAAR